MSACVSDATPTPSRPSVYTTSLFVQASRARALRCAACVESRAGGRKRAGGRPPPARQRSPWFVPRAPLASLPRRLSARAPPPGHHHLAPAAPPPRAQQSHLQCTGVPALVARESLAGRRHDCVHQYVSSCGVRTHCGQSALPCLALSLFLSLFHLKTVQLLWLLHPYPRALDSVSSLRCAASALLCRLSRALVEPTPGRPCLFGGAHPLCGAPWTRQHVRALCVPWRDSGSVRDSATPQSRRRRRRWLPRALLHGIKRTLGALDSCAPSFASTPARPRFPPAMHHEQYTVRQTGATRPPPAARRARRPTRRAPARTAPQPPRP